MKQKTFICNKYGTETILQVGQKVKCFYYHEYGRPYEVDSYKRKWWQLFDKPFKPVKLGVIVGDAGTHQYWLGDNDRKEQYLLVKFKEYFFAKPIPISCIIDANQFAERMAILLEENEHRIGEKGYDLESFNALTGQMNKAKSF